MQKRTSSVLPTPRKPEILVLDDDHFESKDQKSDLEGSKQLQLSSGASQTKSAGLGQVLVPPPIVLFPPRTMTVRFFSSGASNVAVSTNHLVAIFGAIATNATTAYSIHNRVRLRQVVAWPANGGTAGVTFDDTSSQFASPDQVKMDQLPTSISVSRRMIWTPGPKTLQANWVAPSSSQFSFLYSLTSGGVMDVTCELSQCSVRPAVALTSSGMTVGLVYYGDLGTATMAQVGPTNSTLLA